MSQSNQFRIGACYRTVDGSVVTLHQLSWPLGSAAKPGQAFATELDSNGDLVENRGARYLDSGRYVWDDIGDWPGNLLPGEVDEQGNPIEEKPAITLGDLLREKLFGEPRSPVGAPADGCGVGLSKTPTLDHLANTAEPKRPRLTWADSKPVDRFPGFVVKSDTGPIVEADKSPLTSSPDLAGEWKPFEFGSAHLKG